MLDEALAVAYRRSQVEQEKVAVAALLDQLPLEVLREIAETGEIKLAFGVCSPDGGSNGWLEQFKGTPFFQQAIQLEQEDLQTQTANQQASSVENQKSQQRYAVSDQVRLKKKLLELQKAQNEAQVLNSSQGPADMTGSNTAPPPTENPTLPAETTGGTQGGTPKLAGLRRLQRIGESGIRKLRSEGLDGMSSGLAAAGESAGLKVDRRARAAPGGRDAWITHHGLSPDRPPPGTSSKAEAFQLLSPPGVGMPKSASVVDGWAREMARNDMAKVAHAKESFSIADAAGRMMAKTSSVAGAVAGAAEKTLGAKVLEHITKHPEHLTGAVGALGGAYEGASGPDGSLLKGVAGGVAGGGAGYGAGLMGKNLLKGHSLGDSATRSLASARTDARKVGIIGKTEAPKKLRVADDVESG